MRKKAKKKADCLNYVPLTHAIPLEICRAGKQGSLAYTKQLTKGRKILKVTFRFMFKQKMIYHAKKKVTI